MKYAIIQTGGKQFKTVEGQELTVDKLIHKPDDAYSCSQVVFIRDGENVLFGTPFIEGAQVKGKIIGDTLGKKIHIFKFKSKVRYRRKTGFRGHYTKVLVEHITYKDGIQKQIKNTQTASNTHKKSVNA